MSAAERTYRLLLRVYPPSFRAAYEREMLLVFRDQRRSEGTSGVRFWAALLWDVARSAPALRVDDWHVRWSETIHTRGGTMKTMGILAVLVGAIEAVSSAGEGWLGGVVHHDPLSLAAGVVGITMGALLVVAGIALARGTPRATTIARRVAVAALVGMVAFIPRMGVFAMLLMIVFPIALLIFLRRTRGRSTPMVA